MGKTHYIAMAGLHGCIPASCEAYPTLDEAVDDLTSLHELGRNRKRELKRNLCLELNLQRDGNEYCEIEECNCDEPEIHCDSGEYEP